MSFLHTQNNFLSFLIERLNGTIKRKLKLFQNRRKIDVISSIRGIFVIENVDALCGVNSKTRYSITKPKSIHNYEKVLGILDGLRLRKTKTDEVYLENLRQQILYFNLDQKVDQDV